MKKRAMLLIFALSLTASAVDQKSLLLGIGIGLGMSAYQGTRSKVLLPTAHFIQRTVRPIPQDKIEKANRKAAKAARKRVGTPVAE
jgi:hypothetical protein